MNQLGAVNSPTRSKKVTALSAEDLLWSPSPHDEQAITAALVDIRTSLRGHTEGIPWKDHVWRLLLPRARHYVRTWKIRHPQEQTSSVQQRRTSDQYLVLLKKHFIAEIFGLLDGNVLDHLRDGTGDLDPVLRAAIQKRRDTLAVLTELAQREILRKELSQWISNCTKTEKGPRWMQVYNSEYSRVVQGAAECFIPDEGAESTGTADLRQLANSMGGPLYQGRAYSAKELFAQAQPHKDSIMQQAARFLVEDNDNGSGDGTDIRHWRRALDQVWSDTPSDIQDGFLSRAANLAKHVNRGYQHVDKAFREIVDAARSVQAIEGAYAAVVVETRKWSPATSSWEAVRYVCTTIPSKNSKKLQNMWDFTAYDQKLTDWCDTQRLEADNLAERAIWVAGHGPHEPAREQSQVLPFQAAQPPLVQAHLALPQRDLGEESTGSSHGTPSVAASMRNSDHHADLAESPGTVTVGPSTTSDLARTGLSSDHQLDSVRVDIGDLAREQFSVPVANEPPLHQDEPMLDNGGRDTIQDEGPSRLEEQNEFELRSSGVQAVRRDSMWGAKMAALRAAKRKLEQEEKVQNSSEPLVRASKRSKPAAADIADTGPRRSSRRSGVNAQST